MTNTQLPSGTVTPQVPSCCTLLLPLLALCLLFYLFLVVLAHHGPSFVCVCFCQDNLQMVVFRIPMQTVVRLPVKHHLNSGCCESAAAASTATCLFLSGQIVFIQQYQQLFAINMTLRLGMCPR